MSADRRTRWSFGYTTTDVWVWRSMWPDRNTGASSRSFESLAECLTDAMEHGYVAWPLAQDRRLNRGSDALADAEEEGIT